MEIIIIILIFAALIAILWQIRIPEDLTNNKDDYEQE
jgi:hypothetical protein